MRHDLMRRMALVALVGPRFLQLNPGENLVLPRLKTGRRDATGESDPQSPQHTARCPVVAPEVGK